MAAAREGIPGITDAGRGKAGGGEQGQQLWTPSIADVGLDGGCCVGGGASRTRCRGWREWRPGEATRGAVIGGERCATLDSKASEGFVVKAR
jgi:hypothetical protein